MEYLNIALVVLIIVFALIGTASDLELRKQPKHKKFYRAILVISTMGLGAAITTILFYNF